MHSQPSIFCLNYLYRNAFTEAGSVDMGGFSWWNVLQWLVKRKAQKYSRHHWSDTDIVLYLLHKWINRNSNSTSARSVCANLWSSWLVWLRDREWTVEPERTAFTRRVRFPAAGAASYRASWKAQCLSLPGKTGLVKWYLHFPASFSAEEGFRRRKCPVAEKRKGQSSVYWQLYNNTTPSEENGRASRYEWKGK